MNRTRCFGAVLFLALSVTAAGALSRPARVTQQTSQGSVESVIQGVISQYQSQAQFPVAGIAVLVVYKGKTYTYYDGVQDFQSKVPITSNTIFELGSVTKTFTAVEIANAYLSPKYKLDIWKAGEPLNDINLLGMGNQNPGTNFVNGPPCPTATVTPIPPSDYGVVTQMTVEELATHTSTLPSIPQNPFASPTPGATLPTKDRPCYSPQRLINFVEAYVPTPPPSPPPSPGQKYSYSDIGYGTLGYVVQGVYQKTWYDVTRKLIVGPLGMTHTRDLDHIPPSQMQYYATPYTWQNKTAIQWPPDAWPAGGALRSTIPDMTNYLRTCMLIDGPASLRAALQFTEQPFFLIKPPGDFQDFAWMTGYGGTPYRITSKDGGTAGFSSWIAMILPPQYGVKQPIGIVVLTNQSKGPKGKGYHPVAPYLGQQILVKVAELNTH
jgi:CubicO group peptidase (beta-lactamase class C family)